MSKLDFDSHFRNFASSLELALTKYKEDDSDKERLLKQREQIRRLVELETEFRNTLIKHHWGKKVYIDFIKFITEDKRNILAARPYFRERQEVFTKYISGAFKKKNDKTLYKYKMNWSFIEWVLSVRKWPAGGKIMVIANKIAQLRAEILEQNLPLAISQARIFWNSTPKSHLNFMDVVQTQCMALLLAIDKFVPPKDKYMSEKASLKAFKSFRAVAIGIMRRDRVNAYSETLLHFYPYEKAVMYRAYKALRRGDVPKEELAAQINTELDDPNRKTNADEVTDLLAAASTVSADYAPDPEGDTIADSYQDSDDNRPDVRMEELESLDSMRKAIRGILPIFEQKLLQLKGVSL